MIATEKRIVHLIRYPIAVADPSRSGGCQSDSVGGLLDMTEVPPVPKYISGLVLLFKVALSHLGGLAIAEEQGIVSQNKPPSS